MQKIFLSILLFIFIPISMESAESINRILAIVGKISISQFDFDKGEESYKILFKGRKPNIRVTKGSHRSKILDFLIDRALIDITADEESIQAGEKNIEAEVERLMKLGNTPDRASFEKVILEKTGLPFETWFEDLPYQIKRNQLMQLRVNIKPPSEAEIHKWYMANRTKVGNEVKFREICISPKNSSFEEEQKVSNEINQIRKDLKRDTESFNLIANGPRNGAPGKGFNDWIQTFEIYNRSPSLMSALSRIPEGGVSEPYRDDRGKYCIVRLEGKRSTPEENIKRNIGDILSREKAESSFDDWLISRRKELTITVYDKEYISENKLDTPDETFNYNKIEVQSP
jgi:putative peptidyl-prolyl cis-trans isomerase